MMQASMEELESLRVAALNGGNNELANYFSNRILEQLLLVALRREAGDTT